MDFGRLLSRAFQITLHHRALWLYGFLLALLGGEGMSYQFPSGGGSPGSQGAPPVPGDLGALATNGGAMAVALGGLFCVIFIVVIVVVAVQNISLTALIGMADDVERTGQTTVRGGWGYGWSRYAWRNFLISFLVGLVVFVITALAMAVVLALAVGSGLGMGALRGQADEAIGLGFGAAVCLALVCLVPLFIALAVIVGSVVILAHRHVVLRDAGVFDSLGAAWNLFRAHWTSVVGLSIILFIISLAWSLLVWGLAFAVGISLVALPGLFVGWLTSRTWAALLAALPGILLLMAGWLALATLLVTFNETVWTLAYRELTGLGAPGGALTPVPAPVPPAPAAE